jgi:hypothetical protein
MSKELHFDLFDSMDGQRVQFEERSDLMTLRENSKFYSIFKVKTKDLLSFD